MRRFDSRVIFNLFFLLHVIWSKHSKLGTLYAAYQYSRRQASFSRQKYRVFDCLSFIAPVSTIT